MANAERGEVAFEAQGVSYTLRLSINAICNLEDKLGRGFTDIGAELNSWSPPAGPDGKPVPETAEQFAAREARMRLGVVRAVIWAGLLEFHPAITIPQAGEIVEAIGGFGPAMILVSQSFNRGMPKAKPAAEDPQNPPKPGQDGTGSAS